MEQINKAPRLERRDAAENRKRILDVAFRLFEMHGVEHVSMNQIATEAQIGSGTLYRRYRNKSELCSELILDSTNLLFNDIDVYMEQHKSLTSYERLCGLLGLFIQFIEKNAQLLTGIENSNYREKGYQTKSPLYEQFHQMLCNLLQEVSTEDEHSLILFKADMIMNALRNDSYVFQKDVRGHSPQRILEQICQTFI
ncbi:TetR/AcrR family transcriptional regulator [Paenibacillus kyungheensis]